MKTFPDFTWEWIIKSCETLCDQLQSSIDDDPTELPERLKGYIETSQGLIAIVPNLRAHPQLEKLVPMMSLLTLRWFPKENYEVNINYENKVGYKIYVLRTSIETDSVIEEKFVALNEVADELYTYISGLRED